MEVVEFKLPSPISLNMMFNAFQRGGKPVRVKTPKYKAWQEAAAEMLAEQELIRIPADERSFIYYNIGTLREATNKNGTHRKIGSNTDIDNQIKCLADAMVAAGILVDDSMKYVRGFRAVWVEGQVGCRVRIIYG